MSPLDSSPLEPEDVEHLRGLAGVGFLTDINLPSGRKMSAEEAQALSAVFAPAAEEDRLNRAEVRARLHVEPYEDRRSVPKGWPTAILVLAIMGGACGVVFWALTEAFSR